VRCGSITACTPLIVIPFLHFLAFCLSLLLPRTAAALLRKRFVAAAD